jgi:hypothetical protein
MGKRKKKIVVFSFMMPCSFAGLYPESGSDRFLQSIVKHLQDYTAS